MRSEAAVRQQLISNTTTTTTDKVETKIIADIFVARYEERCVFFCSTSAAGCSGERFLLLSVYFDVVLLLPALFSIPPQN